MTADTGFSYAVVRVGVEWKVVCRRRAMGHFSEREQALAAASALAVEAAREGRATEVLIQSETGELISAWRS
jgi:urease gamma subunit